MPVSFCLYRQRHPRVAAVTPEQTVVTRVPFTTSDYSSHTLDEDNEAATSQRRPSTSSEASQPVPSDKSSKTKSEEEEEDEEEEEEDVGEEGDDESEEGTTNSRSSSLLPPPSTTTTEPPCITSTSVTTTPTNTACATTASHLIGQRSSRSSGAPSVIRRARAAIRPEMSRGAVSNWLRTSGFGSLRSKFAKFSGKKS